ncbi:MAG: glycosyltransferase [Chlorobi bacterium]|nr:glycosyltransferase [Chlorobiota bacterium]
MNIIYIGPLFPYRGGITVTGERFLYELQKHGFNVKGWTFKLLYPQFLFPGKTQFRENPPLYPIHIERKVHTMNLFNWLNTARQINSLEPEIVIFRYWIPQLAPSYGTIARLLKKQILKIGFVDNPFPHEPSFMDRFLNRYFISAMDGFLTMSEASASKLKQLTSKPIKYAVHPILDIYPPAIPQEEARKVLNLPLDKPIVLFFGAVRPYKGLDLLIKAAATPPLNQLNVIFLVAGEFYFNSEPEYRQMIDQLGLKDKFIIHNYFIPDDKVHLFFCAADLVVQPYKSATQSGVTQIAYHYEKPMVVTNVGGLPEQVPDHVSGLVVEPDPRQIAKAIHNFFTDEELARRLKEGVKQEKERFSWTALVKAFRDLYGSLK